jgi:two-component system nitrogen regulation response regulator GlnG
MQRLREQLAYVVSAGIKDVLLTGETGTGKEVIAKAIAYQADPSFRFSPVHCGAITDSLAESELFGHEKGAFTGATTQKLGKFELCDNGTIFLDEIGDMSLPTQTKVLRAIQEGEIQRVGGTETIKISVRLLAATNKDLETMVAERKFREDLFYRLNVFRIRLPALRERREDIPVLVDYMLQRLGAGRKLRARRLSPEAHERLLQHDWPGNVRELETAIERAVIIARTDEITLECLRSEIQHPEQRMRATGPLSDSVASIDLTRGIAFYDEVSRFEIELIRRALEMTSGHQSRAAKLLGMNNTTLNSKIKAYHIRF